MIVANVDRVTCHSEIGRVHSQNCLTDTNLSVCTCPRLGRYYFYIYDKVMQWRRNHLLVNKHFWRRRRGAAKKVSQRLYASDASPATVRVAVRAYDNKVYTLQPDDDVLPNVLFMYVAEKRAHIQRAQAKAVYSSTPCHQS